MPLPKKHLCGGLAMSLRTNIFGILEINLIYLNYNAMENIKDKLYYDYGGFYGKATYNNETGKYQLANIDMFFKLDGCDYRVNVRRTNIFKTLRELGDDVRTIRLEGDEELFVVFWSYIREDEEMWAFICKKYHEIEEEYNN